MDQKEINELRRRFRPEKSTIDRVYGCYANNSKEVVSDLGESLGMISQEESKRYLSLLKKELSGSLGKTSLISYFPLSKQWIVRSTVCSPHCGIPSLRTTRPAGPFTAG